LGAAEIERQDPSPPPLHSDRAKKKRNDERTGRVLKGRRSAPRKDSVKKASVALDNPDSRKMRTAGKRGEKPLAVERKERERSF